MPIWEWIQLYLNLTLIGLVDALSPVRIAIILVLLSGTRPVLRSSIFILGIASVSLAISIFLGNTFRLLPPSDVDVFPWRIAIGMVLAVGILLIAIHTWYQHPSRPPEASDSHPTTIKLPSFAQRLSDRILTGNIFVVFAGGVLMQLFSVKSLILLSAALKEISESPIAPASNIVAIIFFIMISTLEMSGPTFATAISPENSTRLIHQMTDWLLRSTYRVVALFEGMLALYLFVQILRDLFTLIRS